MRNKTSLSIVATIILVSAILGSAFSVQGAEYFPLEEGLQWTYTNEVQGNTGPSTDFNGVEAVPLTFSWPMLNGRRIWCVEDPSGPFIQGLTVNEGTYVGPGQWIADSWTFGFETAVRLFDLPLAPGAELFDIVPTDRGDLYFLRTVGIVENLETPYGELEVYPILLLELGSEFSTMVLYVHADLGVVGFNNARLVNVSGIVATEEQTWCGVKSLYR